jgi:hypothetical protein
VETSCGVNLLRNTIGESLRNGKTVLAGKSFGEGATEQDVWGASVGMLFRVRSFEVHLLVNPLEAPREKTFQPSPRISGEVMQGESVLLS